MPPSGDGGVWGVWVLSNAKLAMLCADPCYDDPDLQPIEWCGECGKPAGYWCEGCRRVRCGKCEHPEWCIEQGGDDDAA